VPKLGLQGHQDGPRCWVAKQRHGRAAIRLHQGQTPRTSDLGQQVTSDNR
jgi:hypothetical protein